jgi:hypothetical protein
MTTTDRTDPREALAKLVYRVNNPHHGDYDGHEETAEAILAEGWRPPLPKTELRVMRSLLAGIIDSHFGDDHRETATAAADEIISRGWLDKVVEFGPPEPVATTLRRVLTDLESEAMAHCPVGVFGVDSVEISQTNRVQAETLRAYADRLRQHPTLKGEADTDLAGILHVGGEAGPWYVGILDEDVDHTTEGAPVNIDWTGDGRMVGVEILGSSPLPDSETEWEWGCGSPLDGLGLITEALAREYAKQTGVLRKCRKAGPWIEVTS